MSDRYIEFHDSSCWGCITDVWRLSLRLGPKGASYYFGPTQECIDNPYVESEVPVTQWDVAFEEGAFDEGYEGIVQRLASLPERPEGFCTDVHPMAVIVFEDGKRAFVRSVYRWDIPRDILDAIDEVIPQHLSEGKFWRCNLV